MISVYPADEKLFENNGIKILNPKKATIRKEDNSEYYLELVDSIDNLDFYQTGFIIRVPTPWGKQGFRLSNPKINGNRLSIKAKHLYFDTANYIIKDSYVVDKNCNDALDHLNSNCDVPTPFTTISDISRINSYRCVRHSLEEAIAVLIERYGGHLVRNNFQIEIREKIGRDNHVVLAVGKNIKTTDVDENWDEVVTKILPVGKDGITLDETYLTIEEDLYEIPYSKVVSFEQDHIEESDFTVDGILNEIEYKEALKNDLKIQALDFLETHKYPKVNYSISAYLKEVSDIGDTIYVKHPRCKLDLTTQVIAIEYDVIAQKYIKIEFGNFKTTLKSLFQQISSTAKEEASKITAEASTKLQEELKLSTSKILGALGSGYAIYDGDRILIVDEVPKEKATNVILINNAGIGFSKNGINGPFNSAWTIDGILDMQQINVINLVADMIKGGTLKLGSNLNEAGQMELYDEANKLICSVNKDGFTFYCEDDTYIKIDAKNGFVGYDSQDNRIYWVSEDEFHQKKSVVEEEITIANKLRMIPIVTDTNDGIGLVALI